MADVPSFEIMRCPSVLVFQGFVNEHVCARRGEGCDIEVEGFV